MISVTSVPASASGTELAALTRRGADCSGCPKDAPRRIDLSCAMPARSAPRLPDRIFWARLTAVARVRETHPTLAGLGQGSGMLLDEAHHEGPLRVLREVAPCSFAQAALESVEHDPGYLRVLLKRSPLVSSCAGRTRIARYQFERLSQICSTRAVAHVGQGVQGWGWGYGSPGSGA